MKIQNIEWIDADAKEAIVTIEDNYQLLDCFSHPCTYEVGDEIDELLECLDVLSIEHSICKTYEVKKNDKQLGYVFVGELINGNEGIVKVYDFYIHIDEDLIPNDILEGMYVMVSTSRIDIW